MFSRLSNTTHVENFFIRKPIFVERGGHFRTNRKRDQISLLNIRSLKSNFQNFEV